MNILIFDTETGGVNCYANDILQLSYLVNGLTEEYLATKELSDRHEALNEFIDDLLDCEVCVAHNGDFDKNFINATAQREGIYRFNWPKLIELAECLRIKTDDINLHDSSADVELTKRCFLYLLEKKFYCIN